MAINKSTLLLFIILLSLAVAPTALFAEDGLAAETACSFGEALFKEKRYADAKDELEQCLKLNPQHKKAKELLELCEKELAESTKEGLKKDAVQLALDETEKTIKQGLEASQGFLSEEGSVIPPIGRGAWTLKKDEIYAELYTKYYWHNHQFDNDRKRKSWDYEGKGDELRVELKLEYGFSDRLGLLFYTVAKEAHWKDAFKSSTRKGFTEIWPGAKYLLFRSPFICSLQLKAKFPLRDSKEAVPSLGSHQIDGELKLLTAQPWPKLPGYTKFELGFRARAEDPSNEIPYFFELGYNLAEGVILKTTLDGQEGLGRTGGTNEDYIKGTFGPIFKINELFNIEFGYGNTFAGKNTSAAQEVFLTLSSQW